MKKLYMWTNSTIIVSMENLSANDKHNLPRGGKNAANIVLNTIPSDDLDLMLDHIIRSVQFSIERHENATETRERILIELDALTN